MTEAELISAVAFATGHPRVTVRSVLKAAGDQVAAELHRGHEAVMPELGKLKPVTRASRVARNPKTGTEVIVPAKTGVKFVPKKSLLVRLPSPQSVI